MYFQAIRYRASGRGALGYRKFAKVFSAKIYFQAIRESFLPRKKPTIRYTTNNASSFENDLNDSDNIRSILVSFYTSTESALLSVDS